MSLPKVMILGTGGTVAGTGVSSHETSYTSGQLTVSKLIGSLPGIETVADLQCEQVVNIGSQDMGEEIWFKLAARINELLARDDIDGIVITHGTDTMEETAWFLNLVVKSSKPVVLTGAMRPATALGADGPANMFAGVVVAADKASHGRGVMVVMNDKVHDARDVTKLSTTAVDTFCSPNFGVLGHVHNGKVDYQRSPQRKHTTFSKFDLKDIDHLPRVGIVYAHASGSSDVVDALVDAEFDGIVHAGLGNGNIHHEVLSGLTDARLKGVQVVRSSRAQVGATTEDAEVDDDRYEFIASGSLNAQKARILLQLGLTRTQDYRELREMFRSY
ncbi:type II asparaginase [Endozoicomonadaceae bacterium StTr2]